MSVGYKRARDCTAAAAQSSSKRGPKIKDRLILAKSVAPYFYDAAELEAHRIMVEREGGTFDWQGPVRELMVFCGICKKWILARDLSSIKQHTQADIHRASKGQPRLTAFYPPLSGAAPSSAGDGGERRLQSSDGAETTVQRISGLAMILLIQQGLSRNAAAQLMADDLLLQALDLAQNSKFRSAKSFMRRLTMAEAELRHAECAELHALPAFTLHLDESPSKLMQSKVTLVYATRSGRPHPLLMHIDIADQEIGKGFSAAAYRKIIEEALKSPTIAADSPAHVPLMQLDRLVAIVSDNASPLVACVRDAFPEQLHMRCCAHIANLAHQAAFDHGELLDFLSTVREVAACFSPMDLSEFGLLRSKLLFGSTRWGTALAAMKHVFCVPATAADLQRQLEDRSLQLHSMAQKLLDSGSVKEPAARKLLALTGPANDSTALHSGPPRNVRSFMLMAVRAHALHPYLALWNSSCEEVQGNNLHVKATTTLLAILNAAKEVAIPQRGHKYSADSRFVAKVKVTVKDVMSAFSSFAKFNFSEAQIDAQVRTVSNAVANGFGKYHKHLAGAVECFLQLRHALAMAILQHKVVTPRLSPMYIAVGTNIQVI